MDAEDYSLSTLASAIKKPRRSLLELNKIYQTKIRGNAGVDIVQEEWDNLIILDACRYDLFEDVCDIEGDLEVRISQGSHTGQFMKENFGDDDFPDIVYISANPNIGVVDAGFHRRIRLWEDCWDESLNTVPPKAVSDAAREAIDEYPQKRIIVHYLQPHAPFIGELGQALYSSGRIEHHGGENEFWEQLRDPNVRDDILDAYRENLELVLDDVKSLLEHLDGRTVVTSDHGNAFGRLGVYGHPFGVYMEELVKVPWLVVPFEDERRTLPGKTVESATKGSEEIEEKLEALGYK